MGENISGGGGGAAAAGGGIDIGIGTGKGAGEGEKNVANSPFPAEELIPAKFFSRS